MAPEKDFSDMTAAEKAAYRAEVKREVEATNARLERERSVGAERIAAERRRQITAEGWTPEHDDEHTDGSLVRAAVTYANEGLWRVRNPDVPFDPTLALTIRTHQGFPASTWPWDAEWWKPSDDPIRNLVKAGALIAAEVDRLVRHQTTLRDRGEHAVVVSNRADQGTV